MDKQTEVVTNNYTAFNDWNSHRSAERDWGYYYGWCRSY